MLSKDALECYIKAGRIAAETRNEIRGVIKEGTSILDICEKVENIIRKKGGVPAFPCNVCLNEVAAHYSSPPGDTNIVTKDAIVKVDLGAQIEGYIADTATTVSLNPEFDGMIYAVNEALTQAINTIRPGIKIEHIGKVIQEVIERYGFKPVSNLTGHQMSKYILHVGKAIPNVPKFGFSKVNVDEVFAVEPFLTLSSGVGEVQTSEEFYIFRFQRDKDVKSDKAKKLLDMIKDNFRSLPFSDRWLNGFLPKEELLKAFKELLSTKSIMAYPVLVEMGGKIVAQAEHTVIVTENGCLVTTQ